MEFAGFKKDTLVKDMASFVKAWIAEEHFVAAEIHGEGGYPRRVGGAACVRSWAFLQARKGKGRLGMPSVATSFSLSRSPALWLLLAWAPSNLRAQTAASYIPNPPLSGGAAEGP